MGVPGAGGGAGGDAFPPGSGVGLLTALLPRQGAQYKMPYSLDVDQQLRAALAQGLDQAVGRGLVAGGVVSIGTGLQVVLEATGTVLFFGGLAWVMSADVAFSGLTDAATNRVWAALEVTRRSQGDRQALDAYALRLGSSLTTDPPGADHDWALLATVVTAGGVVTSVTQPVGRYTRLGQHQHEPVLDHPDRSVTDKKLAFSPWARAFLLMGA